MKNALFAVLLLVHPNYRAYSASPPPVIGLCIEAPAPDRLEQFLTFMEEVLAPGGINTLVLMVNYNYRYESYPNLRTERALSRKQVKKLVITAREYGIRLIPHINMLGHQSWHSDPNKLLEAYPQFDETPWVKYPEKYKWPNEDGYYCKSYCPLHPELHEVLFALVDELMEVFEADAFHAGMDEVFYIGEDECPRCSGKDKSELFAGEVNLIHDHLVKTGRELWIWGDRLIDGRTSGLGLWEASENDTYRAIDMIPRDVVICDWHYERADPTAVLFATKGFRVITCPYDHPGVTSVQLEMMDSFRNNSVRRVRDRYYGFMQTVWAPAGTFMDDYYSDDPERLTDGATGSLATMFQFYNQSK